MSNRVENREEGVRKSYSTEWITRRKARRLGGAWSWWGKKTRSHSSQHRGKEGCESQLESDKARNPGANRNPRTDRKYWRLKGTGNLLETELFFLLYPMQFYSRLNPTLSLREGRREVKIHSSLSPTYTPWSRAKSQEKTQRRKDDTSPGWLPLVDSGRPI